MTTPVLDRIWARLDRSDSAACWPWPGARDADGYAIVGVGAHGTARVGRVIVGAERGEHVLHSCDNPPCCNPTHLRRGSAAENALDRIVKKRGVNPIPPSTVEAVRQAIASGQSYRQTAALTGVSIGHISRIINQKTRTL